MGLTLEVGVVRNDVRVGDGEDASGTDQPSQRPASLRGQPLGADAWRPWTVGLAFLGVLGLALAGRATVPENGAGLPPGAAIALIVLSLAPIALALVLANMRGRPTAADFGLRRPPLGRAIALVLGVFIGLTAFTGLWISALGVDGEEGQALTERAGTEGTLTVIVLVVILTIAGPLQEELLFRGYVFRALGNRWSVWLAATAAGVLFAATHVGWVPIGLIVPVVVSGIVLCLLYHWTGSLYPGIALHAVGNSIPLAAALDWTWQTPALIVASTLAALTLARLLALALDGSSAVEATSTGGEKPRNSVAASRLFRRSSRSNVEK